MTQSEVLATQAKLEFRKIRDRLLRDIVRERKTKRQVIDALLKAFDKLLHVYLRVPPTTYAGWIQWGPRAELDELQSAAEDDTIWDRLVERLAPVEPS